MVMGGGGAPKHIQFLMLVGWHIDHLREPPEIVYSGGERPGRGETVTENGRYLLRIGRSEPCDAGGFRGVSPSVVRFAGRSRRMTGFRVKPGMTMSLPGMTMRRAQDDRAYEILRRAQDDGEAAQDDRVGEGRVRRLLCYRRYHSVVLTSSDLRWGNWVVEVVKENSEGPVLPSMVTAL